MDIDISDNANNCEDEEMEEQHDTEQINEIMKEIFGSSGDEDDDNGESDEEEEEEDEYGMWKDISRNTDEYDKEEVDILSDRRFIVGEREILDLIKRSTCKECVGPILPSSVVEAEKIAAGVKYKFTCRNGHVGKWISTPFYGGRSAAAILLQLMVLLSGASWDQFTMGAKFINLAIGSARQFYRMQLQYRVAVQKVFKKHMEKVAENLREIPLSLAVDVRYDTPGFCASKSTAVFMDIHSRNIVHMEIGDSREVGRHSPKMERLLIERGLNYIVSASPYVVWEIISDASRNIISLMRTDPYKHLQHSLDIWHKAKKLAFMLGEIAKKAANKDLLPWIRPVVNHFWYCCSTSKGKVEKLVKRWFGILHHVTNQHFWPGGRCHHPTNSCSNEKWLGRNSSGFQELRKIVTNREWCGSMSFYVNCRQTWAIENFFSHTLLHYVPKRVSYSYDSYSIRNMLAVMDHNNHLHRLPAVTESGLPHVYSHFSRKTKQWVAYEKKTIKEYTYIPKLIVTCMKEIYGSPCAGYTRSKQSKDLDSISANLSGIENPGSRLLLSEMKSRKKCGLAAASSK
ncbi:uncharacterized protein LOC133195811 [Saccostrea echinata]|uniref:uncharacterized protein LOC133195811 n=1 Tax=Saccostrea echinata TaxID=191078 RepID=UPI002A812504|nr:uncharacterized protein LOC133195811 [Saccostrea echinata]